MLDRRAAFNQQINAIALTSCNPHFLYAQIRVGKKLIQEASTGGMKGLVSKSRFQEVQVIVPPIGLQDAFAERLLKIEQQSINSKLALEATDSLFASLQHCAFRGEL